MLWETVVEEALMSPYNQTKKKKKIDLEKNTINSAQTA